jgi:hypothetical protein
MSLNLSDLGLQEVVREIVNTLNAGYVHIVRPSNIASNPFNAPNLNPPLLVNSYPIISFEDGTFHERLQFSSNAGGIFRFKMAIPQAEILMGDYAFIDWSENTRIVSAVVKNVKYNLSALSTVVVNANEGVPYSWSDVQTLLP